MASVSFDLAFGVKSNDQAPMAPVELSITGQGEASRRPDRGFVTIKIEHKGSDQKDVTEKVRETAQFVHDRVKPLAAKDPTDWVIAIKPNVMDWSAMTIRKHDEFLYEDSDGKGIVRHRRDSRSRQRSDTKEAKVVRMCSASISITAGLADFDKLSELTRDLASLPLVTVEGVKWELTEKARSSVRADAVKTAYKDAFSKASGYAEAMGRTRLRPIELKDDDADHDTYRSSRRRDMIMTRRRRRSDESLDEPSKPITWVPQDVTVLVGCQVIFEAV